MWSSIQCDLWIPEAKSQPLGSSLQGWHHLSIHSFVIFSGRMMPSTFFSLFYFFCLCVCVFFSVCLSLRIYLLLSTRSTSLHTCGHWILTVQEDLLNRVLRGKMKFLLVHFWMKNCCEFIIVLMRWCGWLIEYTTGHTFFFFIGPNEGVIEVQVSGLHNLPVFVKLFMSLLQSCQRWSNCFVWKFRYCLFKAQYSASATRSLEVKTLPTA